MLVQAIHAQLGNMLEVIGAEAGMHLVALLPFGVDDQKWRDGPLRMAFRCCPCPVVI